MKKTSISIIIPVYNGEKYLTEALESIICQETENTEIIVVDDGSTDSSLEIVKDFDSGIKLFSQNNEGAGSARNKGIELSDSNFLAFLDADDIWTKDKLKNQISYLENNPEIDMVFGNVEQFISPELSEEIIKPLRSELIKMPGLVAGAMLIRKESFLKVGWFDEKLKLGEFIDWFSRAKDIGLKYYVFDDIVLKRRIHTTNMGIANQQHLKDYTAILRTALARKRLKK